MCSVFLPFPSNAPCFARTPVASEGGRRGAALVQSSHLHLAGGGSEREREREREKEKENKEGESDCTSSSKEKKGE